MATNYTANYGLCQWEPEDDFVRVEFNQDNAKLDTELKRVEDIARESYHALPLLSYNVYNLLLQSYYENKVTGYRRAMVFDGFMNSHSIASTTGAVTVSGNALHLSGAGATGGISSLNFSVDAGWSRAVCWVRYMGGNVTPSINGAEMSLTHIGMSTTQQGDTCLESGFSVEGGGEKGVTVSLALDCGTDASMTVYDYGVIFL